MRPRSRNASRVRKEEGLAVPSASIHGATPHDWRRVREGALLSPGWRSKERQSGVAQLGYTPRVKKGSVAEENAKARLNLVHTTRAFENGEAAFGARYIKHGFARAQEN